MGSPRLNSLMAKAFAARMGLEDEGCGDDDDEKET
jgi:hypothetical protein